MTNLEKLRTATPEQITEMFCHEYLKNCSACPHFVLECCNGGKNGFAEWLNEEAKTQKDALEDAPKGWIKLKAKGNDIYINVSKIVGISLPRPPYVSNKAITAIYTVDTEATPWIIDESIDEVMKKIEKASQEK